MPLFSKRAFLPAILRSPKIVKLLLVQQFFEGFVPIMALYALMFEKSGGLDFEHIGYLFAIWSIVYLIIELPSGVFADYWSRRNVIIVGGLLRAAGLAVWLAWPSFTGYAIGFALWGAQIACTSGAVAAYLHNELEVIGQRKKYAKYFGWITSSMWLGSLAGYLLAAALTLAHTGLLIGISAASSLVFAAVLIFAKESPYKKHDTYFQTLKAGTLEIIHNAKLRYLCFGLFSVYMIIGVLEELFPRMYAGFGLSERAISIVLGIALLVTVIFIARLESLVRFSIRQQVLTMAVSVTALLLGLYFGGPPGVALVLVFSLLFHLFRPLFIHHVQEAAAGSAKATIGSIPGLLAGLFGALAYVAIGKVAAITSETTSIALYGALWLGVLLLLAFVPTQSARFAIVKP